MRYAPLLVWMGLSMGCGGGPTPFVFPVSTVTPAAVGEVVATTGPNGNTSLQIRVRHLAAPDRVSPGSIVYVAWATELEAGSAPRSLGALRVDANLSGALDTVTALRSFELSITPEAAATVDFPRNRAVLTMRITPRS